MNAPQRDRDDRLETLQRAALFGGIEERRLLPLAACARPLEAGAGELLLCEGEPGTELYLIVSGRVLVFKHWQGRQCRLRTLGAGDAFGEMAILDMQPRSASVMALEDCSLLSIGVADLYDLYVGDLATFTTIYINLARLISRRLRQSDDALFRLKMGERLFDALVVIDAE